MQLLRLLFLSLTFTILTSVAAYAHNTYASVTGSRVNVREFPEICDNRLFQVERGEIIKIHGSSGDFLQATINGESGVYIAREFVRFTKTQGTITQPIAFVHYLPYDENPLTFFTMDAAVTVVAAYGDWFEIDIDGTTAFIKQYAVEIPYFVHELPLARVNAQLANSLIETAKNYIGTRYLWGGTTPNGFDCSGFMIYIFTTHHGIELERSSRNQAARNGTPVAQNEIEPADLLFFGSGSNITHVGMYIGGGQFIHSSSDRTGGVRISNLNCAHNSRTFNTARRVI